MKTCRQSRLNAVQTTSGCAVDKVYSSRPTVDCLETSLPRITNSQPFSPLLLCRRRRLLGRRGRWRRRALTAAALTRTAVIPKTSTKTTVAPPPASPARSQAMRVTQTPPHSRVALRPLSRLPQLMCKLLPMQLRSLFPLPCLPRVLPANMLLSPPPPLSHPPASWPTPFMLLAHPLQLRTFLLRLSRLHLQPGLYLARLRLRSPSAHPRPTSPGSPWSHPHLHPRLSLLPPCPSHPHSSTRLTCLQRTSPRCPPTCPRHRL